MTPVEEVIQSLSEKARELHFEPTLRDNGSMLVFHDQHGGDVMLRCDLPKNEDAIYPVVIVRTSSSVYPGERTDLHDCISQLLSAYLRLLEPEVSVTLWDDPNPVVYIEGELYSRWIVFGQPFRLALPIDAASVDVLTKLLMRIRLFWRFVLLCGGMALDAEGVPVLTSDWRGCRPWARRMALVFGDRLSDPGVQFNRRQTLTWNYYRSERKGVSLICSPRFCSRMYENMKVLVQKQPALINAVDGDIFRAENGVANVNTKKDRERVEKLFAELDTRIKRNFVLVPMENSLVAFSMKYTLFVTTDCSRGAFELEREKLLRRHTSESALLFPQVPFEWRDKIDDEEFESLARDILQREPGVTRVRRAGKSRERDAGRDLTVDWITSALTEQESKNLQKVRVARRVVVQCKAVADGLSKSALTDIRDTIEDHGASGFLLITSSYLRGTLMAHLERMRIEKKYFVEWWSRSELEDRLKSYPDLIKKYTKVFQQTD